MLNFKNYMKDHLLHRTDSVFDQDPQPPVVIPEIEYEQVPSEISSSDYYQALLPYYLLETQDAPILENKRSFQFYGARGKKSFSTEKR